jgi:hypothetical protein
MVRNNVGSNSTCKLRLAPAFAGTLSASAKNDLPGERPRLPVMSCPLLEKQADPGNQCLTVGKERGKRDGRSRHAAGAHHPYQNLSSCYSHGSMAYRSIPRRWSANLSVSATIVSVGLPLPLVAKTDEPATYRLSIPCTRRSASTTPFAGSSLIRVVPQ